MPHKSVYPDVAIPDCDLWSFMFDRKTEFADSQVIYRAYKSDLNYTFADVRTLATSFGQGLIESWGWQKGQVFNVFATNSIDIGPLTFGILHAGGIVSPANPSYSVDELTYQLMDSGASAIAADRGGLETARKAARKVGIGDDRIVLVGSDKDGLHWTEISKSSSSSPANLRPRPRLDADGDLAFLVYSSGTTGLPKGVMLSHRNIIADLSLVKGSVGTSYSSGQDKLLAVLPFFHIYGLTGLVLQPLHRGIELVVMPPFELQNFLHAVQKYKITFAYVAPPVIVRLARDPIVSEYDLRSLKIITSGAAPLSKELIDTVHQNLRLKINQAYGLSETSPMTHTQPWDEWYSSVGSIGKLFPNMTAKFMSPTGEEVPVGEQGELWLAGPNVFKGYWKNPEATNNSITADGYFKTGDVGFVDANGDFYITDRLKELIKYQGFQVAPAELEGKLMDHPAVLDVAVIGVNDPERLTEVPRAYIVAGEGRRSDRDAKNIKDWLAERVVYYKQLRGGIRFIPVIPKSPSGKILRRVLKDLAKQEAIQEGKLAKL